MNLLAHWSDEDVDRIYRRLDGGTWGQTTKDAIRAVLTAAEAIPPRDHQGAVGALESLRAAWNEHMKTCPQHAKLPSFEEIRAWMDAPSNTASGGRYAAGNSVPSVFPESAKSADLQGG